MERLTINTKCGTIWCSSDVCTKECDECEHLAKIVKKLAEYEDAEEQNLLLRLPCKIGESIYMVNRYWIDEGRICGIAEADDIDCFCYKVYCDPDDYTMVAVSDFNVTWFLTREEAAQALAKM